MHIARTAATLALVLAAAGCGSTTLTEPNKADIRRLESQGTELASPRATVPLKSGNTIGSGS
jgi:hypothetical protein